MGTEVDQGGGLCCRVARVDFQKCSGREKSGLEEFHLREIFAEENGW